MSEPRTIRFFHDFGHEWPLWESGTDKYTMEPDDYGLSDQLVALLRRCNTLWLEYADGLLSGRPEPGSEARWREASDEALRLLRREVADQADVRDERGV